MTGHLKIGAVPSTDLATAFREALPHTTHHAAIDRIGTELVARWSEPHRHYHTLEHLAFMLSVIDAADFDGTRKPARAAAWFHDAVYDPTRVDNEMRSAELAAEKLGGLGLGRDKIAEVVRLVYLTATHHVEDGDANGALVADADLAILGSDPDTYRAYAKAVREEYKHVPDDLFRSGRVGVLKKILELPAIYHLSAHRTTWEARARTNIEMEIIALRASAGAARHL